MQRSTGLIAVVLGATLLSASLANAKDQQGRVVNTKTKSPVKPAQQTKQASEPKSVVTVRTHENLDVTPEEKRRAATAQHAATAEEQQVAGRVRGLQLLMQKEEQALAQRLAYAAKVRAQGLAKNDQKLLDQAESFERQALDYYQKRVKQFENAKITTGTSSTRSSTKVRQPTRGTRPSSSYRSSRSTSRYRSRR